MSQEEDFPEIIDHAPENSTELIKDAISNSTQQLVNIEEPKKRGGFAKGNTYWKANFANKSKAAGATKSSFARFRQDMLKAYKKLGGVEYLTVWAKKKDTNYAKFLEVFRSMFPKEIKVETPGLDYVAENLLLLMHGHKNMGKMIDITPNGEEGCFLNLPKPTAVQEMSISQL